MRIAAFLSHPNQHLSPLWKELVSRESVDLKVFYFSRHGTERTLDPGFGLEVKWDVDLLEGYESEFLPRQWPTQNDFNNRWNGLNRGINRILSESWDVVYVAGYAHLNNWHIASVCRRNGIKLLYHSDSNFITEKQKPVWQRMIKKVVVKRFFSNVSVFLAAGDHNRDYLQYYGAPADRIRYCAIPVDTVRFRYGAALSDEKKRLLRQEVGLSESEFVVGFCGKMIGIKRPQDVIAALGLLDKDKYRGLFIGGGPLESEMKKMAGERVRFTGFVNQDKIPQFLALCDVMVVSSERDAHPLTVTEAQCLGIPVILSDRCGCYGPNDVFRADESGILYPCGDVEKLAGGIARLSNDKELRSRMGKRANELAELHSAQSTATNFIQAAQFAIGKCSQVKI